MELSKFGRKILLNLLNSITEPEQLTNIIIDDPNFGNKKGYTLSIGMAKRIIGFRDKLPGKKYDTLGTLLEVKGIGKDTFHDLKMSVVQLKAGEKALLIFNSVDDPKKIIGIAQTNLDFTPAALDLATAKNIIGYRKTLSPPRYNSFDEILEVSGIGPATLKKIEDAFHERFPLGGAWERQLLAILLTPYLSIPLNAGGILGNDSVAIAIETVETVVGKEEVLLLKDTYEKTIKLKVASPEERVIDVVYASEIGDVAAYPPLGVPDPATLPEVPTQYAWFRSSSGLYVAPGKGQVLVEVLIDGQWRKELEISDYVFIALGEKGMLVKKTNEGSFGPLGLEGMYIESAEALRITCKGGIKGILSGSSSTLERSDILPPIPSGWVHPNQEVWINPLPDVPWLDPSIAQPTGYLPGGVVISGKSLPADGHQEEVDDLSILVGTCPGVEAGGDIPWPFPWPWPWGPIGGGGFGPPVIYDGGNGQKLTAKIKGCLCIRRPQISEYIGDPSEEGGTYEWEIEDDDIIDFEGSKNEKKVKIKSKDVGKSDLTLKYNVGIRRARVTKKISVIYQKFTEKDNPESELTAIPLVQPAPKVRIGKGVPKHKHMETQIDLQRAKFEIEFKGELKDALVDIKEVEVMSGTDFRVKLSPSGNEYGKFDNDKFEVFKAEVYGPGRSYVRVRAKNNIKFLGSDTLEVVIKIPSHWQNTIERFQESRNLLKSIGATASELAAQDNRMERVWRYALEGVEFEYAWLNHRDNQIIKVPSGEKWSVAVEDDAKSGTIEIKTSQELQSVDLDEKRKKLLKPKIDPKNYFLLHKDYEGNDLRWENEGRLLGEPGEPVSLIYPDPCCAHLGPSVGVEVEPIGVKFIKKDNPVLLTANGKPKQWNGVPGIYTWSCIAHPEGADFRFEPDGPTSSQTVEFYTDTPGIYTFKVKYQLLDANGTWTYALVDGQIIFEVESQTVIERHGNYRTDDLKGHLHRPYYRERTVKDQPGAEIMITNKGGGPLGKDIKVMIACPKELEFADRPIAKIIYTDGAVIENRMGVDKDFKYMASIAIRSARVVEKVHILDIKYSKLTRLKGDAVQLGVQVRPTAPPIADLGGPTSQLRINATAASSPTGPAIATNPIDPLAFGNEDGEASYDSIIINLILRTADLGDPSAGNAVAGITDMDQINLCNGNQFLRIGLFAMDGMGKHISPFVAYNSKAATRAEAVKLYGDINGITKEDLFTEFGQDRLGFGWSSTFEMGLFEFVDIEGDPRNPRLVKCVEVKMPDGNRLVFKERYRESEEFEMRSKAETLGSFPGNALGLVLTRLSAEKKWRLEDMKRTHWIFDKEGRLEEVSDMRMRIPGSKLRPLQFTWDTLNLKIKDSGERETTLSLDAAGRITKVQAADGIQFNFEQSGNQLKSIELPLQILWGFEYGEYSLMQKLIPPEGSPLSFLHYKDVAVDGVKEDIAKHFWGRVFRSKLEDQMYYIRYEARVDENRQQEVICSTAADHRWKYYYDPKSQACSIVSYANATTPENFKPYLIFDYKLGSKLLRSKEDFHKSSTTYLHSPSQHGWGEHVYAITEPGSFMRQFTYNEQDLLISKSNESGETETFQYEIDRQLKRKDYPLQSTVNRNLERRTYQAFELYTYDSYRREKTKRDMNGGSTTFEYGGARDPGNSGQPTTIIFEGQTTELTWDIMGRLKASKNHFGSEIKNTYDELGRIKKIQNNAFYEETQYDKLGRIIESSDSLGTSTSTEYYPNGNLKKETNKMGYSKEYLEYDKDGNLLKMKNEEGNQYIYSGYDALGRHSKIEVPNVEHRPANRNGLFTDKMPDIVSEYKDDPSDHPILGNNIFSVKNVTGQVIKTQYFNQRSLLVGAEEQVGTASKLIKISYDPLKRLKEKKGFHNGANKGVLESFEYDYFDRETKISDGTSSMRFYPGIDNLGPYMVQVFPDQKTQTKAPLIFKRFDKHEREIAEYDGNGVKIKEQEYDDTNHECRVKSLDPSGLNPNLIHSQTIKYSPQGKTKELINHLNNLITKFEYDEADRMKSAEAPNGITSYSYDSMDRTKDVTSKVPGASGGLVGSGQTGQGPGTTLKTVVFSHEYTKTGLLKKKGTPSAHEAHEYDALNRMTKLTRTGTGGNGSVSEELFYNGRGEIKAKWIAEDYYSTFQYDHRTLKTTEILHDRGIDWQETHWHDLEGNVIETKSSWHAFKFKFNVDGGQRITGFKTLMAGREVSNCEVSFRSSAMPNSSTHSYGNASRYISYAYDGNLHLRELEDAEIGPGPFKFSYNPFGNLTELSRPSNTKAKSTFDFHPNGTTKEVKHIFGHDWDEILISGFGTNDYDLLGNPKRIDHRYEKNGTLQSDPNFLESEEHEYDDANRLVGSTFKGTRAGLFNKTFGDWGIYIKFLFPVPANFLAWVTGYTKAEVNKEYYFDEYNRKILEITRLTPDIGQPNEKQVVLHHFSYGAGQAIEEEVLEWYDLGETIPKYIRKKFLFDDLGRRTHEIETLKRGNDSWAKMTQHIFGIGGKPFRTNVYELRGIKKHWIAEDRFVYSPHGELMWSRHWKMEKSELGEDDHKSYLSANYAELSDFENADVNGVQAVIEESEFHYVYSGKSLIAILDKNKRPIQEYLNGEGTNSRLAIRNGHSNKVHEYYNNYIGTSLLTIEEDGEIAQKFQQSGTYGESLKRVPNAVHAGMWANLTRLIQTSARNLDPALGQFISPDPFGLAAGINLYAFANNNPISLKDPSGTYWETAWDIASLSVGYLSFQRNVDEGNFWLALIDAAGIIIDAIAVALPIPGGIGAAKNAVVQGHRASKAIQRTQIAGKAYRTARETNKFINYAQTTDRLINMSKASYQYYQGNSRGPFFDTLILFLSIGIGLQKLGGSIMGRGVDSAFENLERYNRLSKPMKKVYEVGSKTVTNKGLENWEKNARELMAGYDTMTPFARVLLRGKVYDKLPKIIRLNPYNYVKSLTPFLLRTGPTPGSLNFLHGASWGTAAASFYFLKHDIQKEPYPDWDPGEYLANKFESTFGF